MKRNKLLTFFLSLVIPFSFGVALVYGQSDSTANGGGIIGTITSIPKWIPIALVSVYELLVRLIPTAKNWSILTLLMNLVKGIFPNFRTATVGGSNVHDTPPINKS